jgi:hypothetical protein
MHFKNYKSSELYILSNLVHLMSIPITSLQFISCSVASASIARSSPLSPSLSLRPMPDNGACADPTTIAAAAHPRWDPSLTAAARTPPRQRVPPATLLFLFLLHAWQQHIRICVANRTRQITHRGNIHFYHLPCKQARHIDSTHVPLACKVQANKCQQCTHTYTHTDSSCMHAKPARP